MSARIPAPTVWAIERSPVARVSYLLAALTAATLVVALYLTHHLVRTYATSVAVSRDWTVRRSAIFDLAALTAEATPGVDILEDRDLAAYRAREQDGLMRFRTRLSALRQSVASQLGGEDAEVLLAGLQDVGTAMHDMETQIDRLFEVLRRGDRAAAIHQLATAGRGHALVSVAIASVRTRMRQLEEENFARQAASAARIEQLEYVIAACLLVLVGAVTWYGTRLAREVQHLQAEREFALQERYRSLVEHAPDVISTIDRHGIQTSHSPAFETLTGWPASEWIGRPFADLVHPDDLTPTLAVFGALLRGETPRPFEARFRTKSGDTLVAEVRAQPEFAGGEVVGVVAIARDVTSRKRAEAALRESEEKFAKAFRASPSPILITRLRDGLLADVNDAFVTTTGWSRDEVIGRTTRDLLWLEPERRADMVRTLEAEGRVSGLELRMRTKSGAALDVLVSIETIELNGEPHTIGEALDITERKRAAQALRESEEQFRHLIDDLGVGVALLDRDYRVLLCNPAALKMLGATEDEVLGEAYGHGPFETIREDGSPIPPDEQPHQLAAATRRPVRGVVTGHRGPKQTDWTWLLVDAEPEVGPDGQVRKIVVTFLNITERQRAERQLRLLAQAVKSTNEAISITDLEGRFTFTNQAFLRELGYTEDEILGQSVALIDSPRNPSGFQAEIRAATAAGGGWTGELYNRRKDGTDFLLALTTAQVKDPEGRVIALMGVSSNITERRQAEVRQDQLRRALMEAAADWTLTFDTVQYPILMLDADGRIRRVNQAARTLAGAASNSDVTNRTLAELGPGEPWRTMAEVAGRAGRSGTAAATQAAELEPRREWYLTASPVTVTGEEQRIIVIARDVTDLVELQESLRRTETMSALGAVVAGVAHEVRNPLFAISATVDAFEARFGALEKHERYTKTLRQEVNRLSELMHELLEYGKPPRLELAEGPVDPIVRQAIERCATLAETAGVRIVAVLPPDLPAVRHDASRLLQVFQNLIENAVQHSPRGAAVAVGGVVGRTRDRDWVEITIADAGPGFRQEDLPHVFEPFFTRRRGGTGLGLSIVQRIIEQHGGTVTARNRPEGGAVLTVRLTPSRESSPPPLPPVAPIPEAIGVQAPHPGR